MSIVNTLSLESNRKIKINFDGGDLSSDAGRVFNTPSHFRLLRTYTCRGDDRSQGVGQQVGQREGDDRQRVAEGIVRSEEHKSPPLKLVLIFLLLSSDKVFTILIKGSFV